VRLTPGGASQKPSKLVKNTPLRKFIESKPCALCGLDNRHGRMASHHIKRVGAGGHDENNMIPLHWFSCHAIAHSMGPDKFQKKCGCDLKAYAIQLTDEYNQIEASNGKS